MNYSFVKKTVANAIWIIFAFIITIGSFIFYDSNITSYQEVETHNSKELIKSIDKILTLNQNTLTNSKKFAKSVAKSASELEDFEFIGAISTQLIELIADPEDAQIRSTAIRMLTNWNNKIVKPNPKIADFYEDVNDMIETLKTTKDKDDFLAIQDLLNDIFSEMVGNALDQSDKILSYTKKLEKDIASIKKQLVQNKLNANEAKKLEKRQKRVKDLQILLYS